MNEERIRFVEAARSWIGTPYHHMGRIKGIGVDCATLIAECAHEAGFSDQPIQIPPYTFQWNLNQNDESYLNVIRQHMTQFDGPALPGDIVVWKFGRTFSHGAIIVKWPMVIHAITGDCVRMEDVEKSRNFVYVGESRESKIRPRLFFTRWIS